LDHDLTITHHTLQGKGSRVVATMAKKSVGDLTKADLEGKVVFVRADLNVSNSFLIYSAAIQPTTSNH
jgi:phosphoglycerate kinase